MSCEGCEEGAYVIDKLAKLLAEIAIIVNGPEPPLTRWSYHDLPEKVRALKQAQQPAAAVPDGIDEQFAKIRAADELSNAKRVVSRCINALLDIKVMIEEGDYDEAVSHIDELTEGAAMLAAAERKGE